MLTRKEQELKQREDLKERGLKRIIEYDLEVDGTTTCLLYDPVNQIVVARGLAIKSPFDQLDRREGRVRATARALRACSRQLSSGPVETNRYHSTQHQHLYELIKKTYMVKSDYYPRLRSRELRVVREFEEKAKRSTE